MYVYLEFNEQKSKQLIKLNTTQSSSFDASTNEYLNGSYCVRNQKPVRRNFRKFQNDVVFHACTYAS